VRTISRVLSGHSSIRAHLERFKIVGDPICVCMMNYETVDHIIWECSRFKIVRRQLLMGIAAMNKEGIPMRDLCAFQKSEITPQVPKGMWHEKMTQGTLFFVFRITKWLTA
jgi:hypothetical protein